MQACVAQAMALWIVHSAQRASGEAPRLCMYNDIITNRYWSRPPGVSLISRFSSYMSIVSMYEGDQLLVLAITTSCPGAKIKISASAGSIISICHQASVVNPSARGLQRSDEFPFNS